MKATVAERGQITIPKVLREQLGIHPGTILEFTEENGRLVAVKVMPEDPVDRVYGCLGTGIQTDSLIAELRGDV
jgi:AbrB family looped-hinge helix DNA binding protein